MSSISAKGRRYVVKFRKPDRTSTSKRGFRTKREAELFLASTEVRKATGEWIDATASRITIDELGDAWLRAQTHVQPVWGHRRVAEIQHSEVQDRVSQLSSRKGATVVIRALGVLAGIIDRAVKDRRLTVNVARGVNLPRKGKKPRSYLTHDQVQALAHEAGQHRTLVLTLAYTGIRWGEAVGLRANSLDLVRRRVLVRENAVNVAGKIIPGTPKSHESRSVPFPDFLTELLLEQC